MDQWLNTSAADLGRGIEDQSIDPIELVEVFLTAIENHPFKDRIYSCVTQDRARQEAKAASTRAKMRQRRSPLDGVPISWKDLVDSANSPTEAGTKLLEGRVPVADALVLKNATALGLVCLGKTHLSELAFSGLGLNPMTATSPCVNDHDAVSGGSSSGSATSVAFGLAAGTIGSDTGGSVRIPAAWNDLVGLKTTSGRVSLDGVVPLCARFDTIGPLGRTVEDVALLLAAVEGTPPLDISGTDMSNKRLLICETVAFDNVRDAPMAAFNSAVERLSAAGATIDRAQLPMVETAMPLSGTLFATEAYGTWKDVIEAAPEKMFAEILTRFRTGKDLTAADYVGDWQKLDALRLDYLAATAGYDAVILPSSPILPPNIERLLSDRDYYVEENLLALRNTRIGNLMGLCALTLPTGVPSAGIMFMGQPNQEEQLLRLGAAAEAALS